MKVVHSVHFWLEPTEGWIHRQVRGLEELGGIEDEAVECHVVCRRIIEPQRFPHPRIHPLASASACLRARDRILTRLGVRRHLAHLARVVRRERADILHSHFGNHGWENHRAAQRLRLAHAVSFYGQDACRLPRVDSRWRRRYRDLFESADAVLCEGPCLAGRVIDLGCPEEKVRIHALGVNVEEIPFRPRRWTEGRTLRVLMAATFREKKGIPFGLEALAALRRDVELEITIIGDAGPERRSRDEKGRILEAIERLDLARATRRLGCVPHDRLVAEALEHHIFLAPSITASDGDSEGGAPVVLIDIAATGMPIVSTRHGDIPGIVEDGVTGKLAGERDAAGLEKALRELITAPESWEEMGRAARRRIEERFSARTQARRLARIYREIVGCPVSAASY